MFISQMLTLYYIFYVELNFNYSDQEECENYSDQKDNDVSANEPPTKLSLEKVISQRMVQYKQEQQ